jgi:NADH-quinone oxidoreductase subunit L
MTHAFFKALLFLAAGSVIMAMHHEQDMRKMGGLRKYMPITYWTFLVGSLALIGFPGTSGFFSKDLLIDAVHPRTAAGLGICVFLRADGRVHHRALYLPHVLHDLPRQGAHGSPHPGASAREPVGGDGAADPAGDSLGVIGWFTVQPVLFGGYFAGRHPRAAGERCAGRIGEEFHGSGAFLWAALTHAAVFRGAGVFTAWLFFLKKPALAGCGGALASSGCTRSWSISTASTGSTSTSSCRRAAVGRRPVALRR